MSNHDSSMKQLSLKFLDSFELAWVNALKKINCNHKQLMIGSRLRPQIALWGYLATIPNFFEIDDLQLIAEMSVSIEMIHKASLLIDDWIDGDEARHGESTFHISHSPQYAVIMAIFLVSESMHRIKHVLPADVVPPTSHYRCVGMLADTVHAMSLGALHELELSDSDMFDIDKIAGIAHLETAEILGNGMLMGYYLGGGNDDAVASTFKIIGDQCGYLFQTMNDLEAFGNKDVNAKHKSGINYDIDGRRKNIAISKLYHMASAKDRLIIQQGTGYEISALISKYSVIDILMRDMEIVFQQVVKSSNNLTDHGLRYEWLEGFVTFLGMLKGVASQRLDYRG